MRQVISIAVCLAFLLAGCGQSSPTAPDSFGAPSAVTSLALRQWGSSERACLTVEDHESTLLSGCWRGRFPTPTVSNGTFVVDGTFRFEAGPTPDTPAPPARFQGTVSGTTLSLTVQQLNSTQPPVTLSLEFHGEGSCVSMCV